MSEIKNIIDAAHEAAQEPPRGHLGASLIGHECDRYIWLSFRWAVVEKFSGRMLRLFRRGHMEEKIVMNGLRLAGCQISTIDPETRKQWHFKDGHFQGSCDGIITSGVPEAPNVAHLLEVKTHSAKSFADLEKNGVLKSKPQHYAQMQVYMGAFNLKDALYYAINKDNDEVYTERVKHEPATSATLFASAQVIIDSDCAPPPLTTDPTFYKCKFCSAHDLCHGSKITKEVNCRTCAHSTAERDGTWTCAQWDTEIPDIDAQRAGCDSHILHPDLVPGWSLEPAEHGVIWLTPAGKIHNAPDGHTSREIVANWQACAKNVKAEWSDFGAKVVG